jgi:hypothetical protein
VASVTDDEERTAEVVPFPGGKRGYSWPPFEKGNTIGVRFEPGNEMGVRHGAYLPRKVDPLAESIIAPVLAAAGVEGSSTSYLTDASYRPTLWAWARTEARIQLVSEWLLDRGSELDKDGDAVGAANLLNRLEARAESLRSKLGLDPLSRARLGRDVAAGRVDMAKLMAEVADEGSS